MAYINLFNKVEWVTFAGIKKGHQVFGKNEFYLEIVLWSFLCYKNLKFRSLDEARVESHCVRAIISSFAELLTFRRMRFMYRILLHFTNDQDLTSSASLLVSTQVFFDFSFFFLVARASLTTRPGGTECNPHRFNFNIPGMDINWHHFRQHWSWTCQRNRG